MRRPYRIRRTLSRHCRPAPIGDQRRTRWGVLLLVGLALASACCDDGGGAPGSFTITGDVTWTTLLAGPASDLGLGTGTALPRPTVMGSLPAIPTGLGDTP